MERSRVTLTVNGQVVSSEAESRRTLVDFLREEIGLTGTHVGCEHGVCGSCTVIMNGDAVRSCLILAVQAAGSEITTIEGLAADGEMNVVQEAMWECHAFQCGFCTPGFLMTVTSFLDENPDGADRETIREYLSGNVCRCSGYQSIVDAVELAVAKRSGAN
jgi:aerobic carbon-monoxide dehydrogenase small subunit